jgi:hypothetical protein
MYSTGKKDGLLRNSSGGASESVASKLAGDAGVYLMITLFIFPPLFTIMHPAAGGFTLYEHLRAYISSRSR